VIGDFSLLHLRSGDEVEEYLELMRRVFGEDSRVDLMVKKWVDHHSRMTLEDFFAVQHRGRMVAALCLIPSEWSIGGIRLRVAELGCVATLPEYRLRGLQRNLMAEYNKRVLEQGYDMSAIEGIPYFYRQFGYEYALPLDEQARIRLDEIPEYSPACTIRPFTDQDVSKAMELLERSQRKFYVHSVRDEGTWKMQQKTQMVAEYEFEGYCVEQEGQMTAYFRTSQNPETKELFLREITDVNASAAHSIMGFLKKKAVQSGLENLILTISHHELFAKHLAATAHKGKLQPYAWQISVGDYLNMLRKMKTLLEERLRTSEHNDLTAKLDFNFFRYTVRLTIESGVIKDVQRLEECEDKAMRFNPTVFQQLLLGYRSREELELTYPDFIVRPSHRPLIDILFPKLPSYIHTVY
jgi:predicted acetyltransferase